ncbi:MAG: PIN domain-containing protein [Leptolyngbyaceae cyanobacterium CAN_BIN12]|nr:PIN domain-containing protein [Leptolyngbyaceae cyanobacterium CAN_BIN12]
MSSPRCFVDSNVWLYRLLAELTPQNKADARKRSLATDLTNAEDLIISTQVVNEVCSVLSRKASLSESQIKQIIQEFYEGCVVTELSVDNLLSAADLRLRYGFSFWDGLIVASALSANAEILYSEDMQSGLVVSDRLEIVNPFQ